MDPWPPTFENDPSLWGLGLNTYLGPPFSTKPILRTKTPGTDKWLSEQGLEFQSQNKVFSLLLLLYCFVLICFVFTKQ